MENPFKNVKWAVWGKGLLILIVSTMFGSLVPIFQDGGWPTWLQFQPVLFTTVSAAIVYISKSLFVKPAPADSKIIDLNFKDIFWALIIVVGSALLSQLADLFYTGWPTWATFKPILISSAIAGGTYLMKNFVTNSDNKFLKPEPK